MSPRSTDHDSTLTATPKAVAEGVRARYLERTARSRALYSEGLKYLPGGDTRAGTFYMPYPTYIAQGLGARVWDVDGNEYLDLLQNFTSIVHGHAHPYIHARLTEQLTKGTSYGAPTELQNRLAQLLVERVDSVDQVRFVNSGNEANAQAIRAARAFTGRHRILKMEGAYHGVYEVALGSLNPGLNPPDWPEPVADGPGLSPGLLDETLIAPFNDLCATDEIIRRHKNELAAVLVEPVMGACGMIPAEPAFLEGLREVTRKHGVVLVFDEVITFRLAPGGAQQVYGVSADLTTFGKIIGGGLPVGAFGGREDVMSLFDPRRAGGIQHSGTFNANTATMAAGIAALELLTPERILEMNRLGSQLRKGLQQILDDAQVAAHVTGAGSLAHVHLTDGLVRDYRSAARANTAGNRLLHLALLNRGVFSVSRGMFITSTALRECDVEFVLTAYADAVQELMPALSAPPGSWFTIEGQS